MANQKIEDSIKLETKGDVIMDTTKIQSTIREYFEKLYCNKFENQEEMGDF